MKALQRSRQATPGPRELPLAARVYSSTSGSSEEFEPRVRIGNVDASLVPEDKRALRTDRLMALVLLALRDHHYSA